MPNLVYWNVDARQAHFAAAPHIPHVFYVSGASANMMKHIMESNLQHLNAEDFMMTALQPFLGTVVEWYREDVA